MPYIGTQPLTGQFKKLDAISVVNGQAAYTLNYNSAAYKPATANALLVSVNGVIQAAGDAYTISGSTITFTENLVTGDVIDFIIALGDTGSAVTPVDGSVTTAKIANDAVTADKISSLPAGSILQVVSTTKTDAFTATAGTPSSPLDVTGLSLNITPISTSSKILVRASLNYGGLNNVYGLFFFKRGSTDLTISTYGTGSQLNAAVSVHGDNSNFQYGLQSAAFEFLDSPSSTSQLTYKVQMASRNGSQEFYLNRPHVTDNANYIIGGTSTFTLMEIAG